jgi:hypothetical protein
MGKNRVYTQLLHVQRCGEREEFDPATKAIIDISLPRKINCTQRR